jgi:hypothetical protein
MESNMSNKRVERIMKSLDGIHKASAPDFFYTRLKGKMQPVETQNTFFMFRPAFITAALSVFLIVNVFSLVEMNRAPKQKAATQNNPGIGSFADAYNMNTASVYE